MLAATFFFFFSVKHQKADVAVISNDLNRRVTDLLKAGLKAQQISCRSPTTAVSLWNSPSSWYHATVHLPRPHYPLPLDLVDSLSRSEPPSQRSSLSAASFRKLTQRGLKTSTSLAESSAYACMMTVSSVSGRWLAALSIPRSSTARRCQQETSLSQPPSAKPQN